jgi:sugar phosphate isomerase/epimerase
LGGAIHHCHGKDTRIEQGLAEINGLLELKGVDDVAKRAWNYVAVGAGHDLQWWKEFFSVVRMVGYNDWVSLESEVRSLSRPAISPVRPPGSRALRRPQSIRLASKQRATPHPAP